MQRIPHSNFIIISGGEKKVGKTHLAVALIQHFAAQSHVIALKISPHKHDRLGSVFTVEETEGFRLYQELDVHEKNSGRFLKAGAKASFFLETGDDFLEEAMKVFLKKCNPGNLPVVCESGALGTIIKPGVLIFITYPGRALSYFKDSLRKLADQLLPARQFSSLSVVNSIQLVGNRWMKK